MLVKKGALMKIALICDSLLLDKSLEMYLKEYLTSYKLCDFVVATQPVETQKPVFLIGDGQGVHLKIPFTKELLFKELESFYQNLQYQNTKPSNIDSKRKEPVATQNTNTNLVEPLEFMPPNVLNVKIEAILRRYAKEIEEVVTEHFKGI